MQLKKQLTYESLSKYRSVLMGLQILFIIFFHFTDDCRIYDVHYSGIIYLFNKYIHSSGVDIFLLLSGIGLYFSWKKKPEPNSFYRKRYIRILIPYLIVAIPAWLWRDVFFLGQGWNKFIMDVSFISFFRGQAKWFWYILMIGICYWVFPYIFRIAESASDRVTEKFRVLALCLTSTVFLIMLQSYHGELYMSIGIAVARIPAFVIGVFIGKAVYEKRELTRKTVGIFLILSFLASWPLQMADKSILGVYVNAVLNFACSLFLVAVLFFLSERKQKLLSVLHTFLVKGLGWFGKYTLELYLLHVVIRRVMNDLGYHTCHLFFEAVMLAVTVILSLALNRITSAICKKLH